MPEPVYNDDILNLTQNDVDLSIVSGRCPVPGCAGDSNDFCYDGPYIEGQKCYQYVECSECDAKWTENYEFTGVDGLEQPGGIRVVHHRPVSDRVPLHTCGSWDVIPLDHGHYFVPMIKTRFLRLEEKGWPEKIHAENIGNKRLIENAGLMFDALAEARSMISDEYADAEILRSIDLILSKVRSLDDI